MPTTVFTDQHITRRIAGQKIGVWLLTQKVNKRAFTCEIEVLCHFLKLVHVSLFLWAVQDNWTETWLGDQPGKWKADRWEQDLEIFWEERNVLSTHSSQTIWVKKFLWHISGLSVPSPDWPAEIEFSQRFSYVLVWVPNFLSCCNFLPPSGLIHWFHFMNSFNYSLRMIANVEMSINKHWNSFFFFF